jgi:putative peptidoglycan lipid II flippase
MAGILGAGPLADAFMVAFRLPNHFRTIFAEGAFNAAFVPRYSASIVQSGEDGAREFAGKILGMTLAVQAVLLVVGLLAAPFIVTLIAPGFTDEPGQSGLTATLLRITWPYLVLISVMTLFTGVLAGHHRFMAAAAAPILLNFCLIGAMLLADHFPTAAHALAWGVLASGFVQLAFVWLDARRLGLSVSPRWPKLTPDVRAFLKSFGPAIIGSTGPQLAILADTIIASLLPSGSVSYLYYAERLYQLPVAVIGIAVGTVLLPDLARRLAAHDHDGARRSLNRAVEGSLLLTLPFVAMFTAAAAAVVSLLFERGAFGALAVAGSSSAREANANGLPAVVAMRSLTASFYARGDTMTPVKALAAATIANIGLKIVLVGPLAHAGLALATSAGAWVNAIILCWLLRRDGSFVPDRRFAIVLAASLVAFVCSVLAFLQAEPLAMGTAWIFPPIPQLAPVTLLTGAGFMAYALVIAIAWLALRRRI